jgi:hypothetical protein
MPTMIIKRWQWPHEQRIAWRHILKSAIRTMRRDNRWRHIPARPVGLYRQYLTELVARARAKRESGFVDDRQFTGPELHEPLEELPPCERKDFDNDLVST